MGDRTLDEWAQLLAYKFDEVAAHAANEMEVREGVHGLVLEAAADLYGAEGFTSTAERSARGKRRHYDRLYGGVVVEWEFEMGAARREYGAKQAVEYLDDVRKDRADAFTAVVADGKQWGFLVADSPEDADLFTEVPEGFADRFDWQPNSPATCRKFLEMLGAHKRTPVTPATLAAAFGPVSEIARRSVAVMLEALAARAADDRADTLYKEWRRALDVVYGDLDALEGTLVDAVEQSYHVQLQQGVGEALFVLHSYFALVARLIAVEILAAAVRDHAAAPTAWALLPDDELLDRLEGLDRGDLPGGLSIDNLFETDTFSWWHESARGNADLLDALRRVLSALDQMSFPRVVHGPAPAGDVLRDLYQSLVPRQMRKALGEFLTPAWLADACLDRLATLGASVQEGRVLDPTCGTGTFLVPVLSARLRALKTRDTNPTAGEIQAVLNTVCGIDLNPVAVVAARVNYVVALGDLASAGDLTIPVYRADSLLVPQLTYGKGELGSELAGLRFHELKTSLPTPFVIPESFAHADLVARLRQLLEAAIEDESRDGRDPTPAYEAALTAEFGPGAPQALTEDAAVWANELTVARALLGQIRDLNHQERDHVWARIIENAFAPLFAGRFDVVIGNPPWLTWTKLPERWRHESERMWRRYGLWKVPREHGAVESLASTDLAILVFAVALERYAAPDGFVGLLTPDSVITADPGGRAFRRFSLESEHGYEGHAAVKLPFRVIHVDNWGEVQPFAPEAANRPIFAVARPGVAHTFPVPGVKWARAAGRLVLSGRWAKVRALLDEGYGSYKPIDPATHSSALSFQRADAPALISGGANDWAFGKGLDTRGANGVYFVRLISSNHPQGLVQIVNLPTESRHPRPPEVRGQVESRLVYPLLRGKDVAAWSAKPSTYVVLPHDPESLGDVLSDDQLRTKYPKARGWLRRFYARLRNRKTPPTRSWKMNADDWCRVDGPLAHMDGQHIVVVREISDRPAAAVVEARMDYQLGRKTAPLIDHKLMFCSVGSREEALYLAGFINSTPVQDLLRSYINAAAVSPTTLSRLPIPPFDPANPDTIKLVTAVAAVVAAADPPQEAAKQQATMDAAVLALVGADATKHQPQPRKPRRARHRRQDPPPEGQPEPLF